MSNKEELTSGNWFVDLMMQFVPDTASLVVDGTPQEMTRSAAWKAFTVSTGAALPPGPLGWATIVPEIITVTKLQINLIYRIAKYYRQEQKVNSTILMLIFANEAGLALGRSLTRRVADRLIIRAVGSKAIRPMAQSIGTRIGSRISAKLVGRWIPVILAPVFGAFSKSMTAKIGQIADNLFTQEIEFTEIVTCPNGHEVEATHKFCPECGSPMSS